MRAALVVLACALLAGCSSPRAEEPMPTADAAEAPSFETIHLEAQTMARTCVQVTDVCVGRIQSQDAGGWAIESPEGATRIKVTVEWDVEEGGVEQLEVFRYVDGDETSVIAPSPVVVEFAGGGSDGWVGVRAEVPRTPVQNHGPIVYRGLVEFS